MKLIVISRDSQSDNLPALSVVINPDSVEGQHTAQLYGIMEFPAYIAVREDGTLVQLWQGKVPSSTELSHWLNSAI